MMKSLWRSLVAIAMVSAIGARVSSAAILMIDDFASVTTPPTKTIDKYLVASSEGGLGSTVLGGVREAFTQRWNGSSISGATDATALVNTAGAGTLSFSWNSTIMGAGNGAALSLWYDGNKNSSFGATLSPVSNFVNGNGGPYGAPPPNTDFVIENLSTTADLTIRVSLSTQGAYSSAVKSMDYAIASNGGTATTTYLSYSKLTTAFPNLDLTKVQRVRFDFIVAAGTNINFSTTRILASTPEPSTIAMLGMGAVGLVVAHRRRKAKAN